MFCNCKLLQAAIGATCPSHWKPRLTQIFSIFSDLAFLLRVRGYENGRFSGRKTVVSAAETVVSAAETVVSDSETAISDSERVRKRTGTKNSVRATLRGRWGKCLNNLQEFCEYRAHRCK